MGVSRWSSFHLIYYFVLFRFIDPRGSVHWHGQISVLPAPCIPLRTKVEVHNPGCVTLGIVNGRPGNTAPQGVFLIQAVQYSGVYTARRRRMDFLWIHLYMYCVA